MWILSVYRNRDTYDQAFAGAHPASHPIRGTGFHNSGTAKIPYPFSPLKSGGKILINSGPAFSGGLDGVRRNGTSWDDHQDLWF